MRVPIGARILCVGVLLGVSTASAGAVGIARTFVSVNGNDINDCSNIATPCRTFAGGIALVDDGGEVIVLDTGSYGGTTITKGVTINAPPGIVAFAAQPFTVNAPGKAVTLRGLTIKALTPGSGAAITYSGAGRLTLEGCTMNGWGDGLSIFADGVVIVRDSVMKNNIEGVIVRAATSQVDLTIDHCKFENNSDTGFWAQLKTTAWVTGSVFSGNSFGITVGNGVGSTVTVNIFDTLLVRGGGTGVKITDTCIARLSNVTSTNYAYGVELQGSGVGESYGNNHFRDNFIGNVFGSLVLVSPF